MSLPSPHQDHDPRSKYQPQVDCAQQNGALDATVDIARQIWNNTTDGSGSAKEKRGVCEWLMLEFPRQVWDRRFADTEKGKEAWGAERVRCGFK